MDSAAAMALQGALEFAFGVALPRALLLDAPTARALARALVAAKWPPAADGGGGSSTAAGSSFKFGCDDQQQVSSTTGKCSSISSSGRRLLHDGELHRQKEEARKHRHN